MNAYTKLTGRRRTLTGYTQLWLAADHLLLVRSTRFTEQYQRFLLRDIQAIVVTELADPIAFQMVVLAAIVACAAGFFSVTALFGKIVFGVMTAVSLATMIGNIARGPRCRCHLQTAVSHLLLPPVSRVRAGRELIQKIVPAIEAVQGTLAPEVAARIEATPSPAVKPPDVPDSPSYLPEAVFGLLLLDAALIAAMVRFPQAELGSVLLTTMFGELALLIAALIRRGRDARRFIYFLMVPALVLIGWDTFRLGENFIGWLNGIAEATRHGEQATPSMLDWAAFSPAQAFFAASWRLGAGGIGLIASWLERSRGPKK